MSLAMEGETRKRKITTIEEDEDEDEDIKIEKFFALIRSAKDIRDQLIEEEEGSSNKPQTTKQYCSANIESRKNKMYMNKKAVARTTAEKKTTAEVLVPQKCPRKPPQPQLKQKAPAEDNTGVSVAAAAATGSGGGCSGSSFSEEKNNTGASGHMNSKNSYQQGRIFLDLNLSL